LPAADRARIDAEALAQLIDRRLVLHYLARHDATVSRHHVDAAVTELKAQAKQQKISWKTYLKQRGVTEAAVRSEINWRLSWQRYLAQRITDDVLQKHFEQHRKEFDGTRVRVHHILLIPDDKSNPQALAPLAQKAMRIRQEILDGKTTFAAAVAAYSQAPSKASGGDLGFVTRHGEMVGAFAAAAFALEPHQISPPVTTPFGVHLIQCVAIEPGKKTWTDVADQLRSAVTQRGFRRIADGERQHAAVKFTGKSPYRDPETGRLALPTAAE
jgi:parvulin-like peptidyl-prolyl isomerase